MTHIYGKKLCQCLMVVMGASAGMSGHAELIIHSDNQAITDMNQINTSPLDNQQLPDMNVTRAMNVNRDVVPSEASIVRLMQVMHIDKQIDKIVAQRQQLVKVIQQKTDMNEVLSSDDMNEGAANQNGIGHDEIDTNTTSKNGIESDDESSARQQALRKQIQQVLTQYSQVLTDQLETTTDADKLRQAYIDAAKAHYTQAEVTAQIEFYQTPVGQSVLQKQPQVMATFVQRALPDINTSDATSKEQLQKMLPAIRQIFTDVF